MSKAMIAMSGGVDSSVAAYLMKQAGFECAGATMKLYTPPADAVPGKRVCGALSDIELARSVAESLSMPFHVICMEPEFEEAVIGKFIRTYLEGRTPNPCIDCNRHLKFDALVEKACAMGMDFVASGHYARISFENGRYLLYKGLDASKDQSYVLYTLTQHQLAHIRFPLGTYTKEEIRRIAEEQGFLNAHKPDSQDICFVPDGDYGSFIEKHTGKNFPEGNFILADGRIVGRHKGQLRYTIGQRRGLGVAWKESLYVLDKSLSDNTILLGTNRELFHTSCTLHDLNLIAMDHLDGPVRCNAKARYRHQEQPCTLIQTDDDTIRVIFDEPQRAITPGQSCVFYDGDLVLGGGTIQSVDDQPT